ncbi:hypothetical protein BDR04DRAFT_1088185 [Suillus decipiens]|nr:hypothetical protein BDR04DRAFT_1088185 [Suillus decipiens]
MIWVIVLVLRMCLRTNCLGRQPSVIQSKRSYTQAITAIRAPAGTTSIMSPTRTTDPKKIFMLCQHIKTMELSKVCNDIDNMMVELCIAACYGP